MYNIEEIRNKIIHGDALDELKKIPSNSITNCITDPPYNYEFIGRNWDEDEIKRRTEKASSSKSTLVKNIPYGSGLSGGVRNKNWYKRNRDNIVEYSKWLESWGEQVYRVLKPGSFLLIFNSNRTIAQVQVAMENVGFYARDILIWKRNTGIPKGLNVSKKLEQMGEKNFEKWEGWNSCLLSSWEGIAVLQKPLQNNYIETLKNYKVGLFKTNLGTGFQSNILDDIVRDKVDDYNSHPTVKPLDLIERLLLMTTPLNENHIILDPFMGSGTTAVACIKHNLEYVGIEINKEYHEIASKRIKDTLEN